MNESASPAFRPDRRWRWCGLVALGLFIAAMIPVPTTLGVKVPETSMPGIDPSQVDTSGNDQIWRVWWRARDDMIDASPQWMLTVVLTLLLALFVIALLAAVWFALAPGHARPDATE
jgi:hypothetical protein